MPTTKARNKREARKRSLSSKHPNSLSPSRDCMSASRRGWGRGESKDIQGICPICEDGSLTEHFDGNIHFSTCNGCGSDQANPDQIMRNKIIGRKRGVTAEEKAKRLAKVLAYDFVGDE